MNQAQFDEHAVWTIVDGLKEMLGKDLAGEVEEGRDEIRTVHSVVQYIDSHRGTDPALVDQSTLDSLNTDLTQARDYLTSYLDDRDANAAILTANVLSYINSARTRALQNMPAPTDNEHVRSALEATNRYRDAADAEIATLRERADALNARLAEVDEQRTEDAGKAQAGLSELQTKITESEQTVAVQTTQLQAQIETQRAAFMDEAEQREAAFADDQAARQSTAEKQNQEEAENAQTLLSELQGYREQARGLIEATGRDAVSGDYQVWAKSQGKIAKWWNVAAVAVGLITVGALVWVVLGARNDTTQFLISKSSVGLIGLIVAGYAGRQASEHRAEERTAKRLGLDLAALEPFLENVENPQELRVEIARRVFAPERETTPDERRVVLGRRGMSIAELTEFVNVIRNPPSSR